MRLLDFLSCSRLMSAVAATRQVSTSQAGMSRRAETVLFAALAIHVCMQSRQSVALRTRHFKPRPRRYDVGSARLSSGVAPAISDQTSALPRAGHEIVGPCACSTQPTPCRSQRSPRPGPRGGDARTRRSHPSGRLLAERIERAELSVFCRDSPHLRRCLPVPTLPSNNDAQTVSGRG